MDQFPRSCCLYHPGEIITNFCVDKGCLMPLCPSCICTHAETHPNGRPNLAHINDILRLCLKDVQGMLNTMETTRLATESVNRKINDQKESWIELIEQTKLQTIEIINTHFEGFKKEVQLGSEKQNKILGLHVPERMKSIQTKINDQTSQLIDIKNDLYSDRSLSTLITFYHESKNAMNKSQIQIQQQIKSNETYSPRLVLLSDAFQKLKSSLTQFFTFNIGSTPTPKNEMINVRVQSPRTSYKNTPVTSLMHSRVEEVYPSLPTSRNRIDSPFKNLSNMMSTYPEPEIERGRVSLELPKFNITQPIQRPIAEQKSPRSSLGIKLMAQSGGRSARKQGSFSKNKAAF